MPGKTESTYEVPMYPNLEEERALEPRMKLFLNSPAMYRRVQDIIERQATGRGPCMCATFAQRASFEIDGSRTYTYRVNKFDCPMHPTAHPSRYVALRENLVFPFDAEKTELIAISENRNIASAEGEAQQEHGHHRDAVTTYRDIELLHEDETRVNRDKFNPGRIDPGVEITADNWMKFI